MWDCIVCEREKERDRDREKERQRERETHTHTDKLTQREINGREENGGS